MVVPVPPVVVPVISPPKPEETNISTGDDKNQTDESSSQSSTQVCVPIGQKDPYQPEAPPPKDDYIAHQKLVATIIICLTVISVAIIVVSGVVVVINKRRQLVHDSKSAPSDKHDKPEQSLLTPAPVEVKAKKFSSLLSKEESYDSF